jgi:hypothetical protein
MLVRLAAEGTRARHNLPGSQETMRAIGERAARGEQRTVVAEHVAEAPIQVPPAPSRSVAIGAAREVRRDNSVAGAVV